MGTGIRLSGAVALALALVIYYSMRNSSGRSHIPQSFLKGAENGGSK